MAKKKLSVREFLAQRERAAYVKRVQEDYERGTLPIPIAPAQEPLSEEDAALVEAVKGELEGKLENWLHDIRVDYRTRTPEPKRKK